MCISFFSMPLYMKYFKDDSVLGAWYTILSIVNWIYIFDFGMGNSLRNKLVFALTNKDYGLGRSYIETSYTIVSVIASVFIIIAVIATRLIDLNSLFDVSSSQISPFILNRVVLILSIGVILCFSLKTINAVLFAYQKAMFTSISTLCSSVFMLLFIFLYRSDNQETALTALGITHSLAIVIPLLVTTVITFSTHEGRKIRPYRLRFKYGKYKDLLSLGITFFAIQILSLFVISTNEMMITNIFSSSDVVEYSIYHKVFNVASSVVVLAVVPIWSKITQYISKNEYNKVKQTYKRLLKVDIAACILIFLMVPVLQIGFNLWLKSETIKVNYFYALIFAFYTSCYISSIVLTTVANGTGKLKPQLIYNLAAAVLKIPLVLWLAGVYSSWITVLISVCVPMSVFCFFQHRANTRLINHYRQSDDKKVCLTK